MGFELPYLLPLETADAWMVKELRPKIISNVSGRVICCNTLNKPELWKE